VAAGAQAASPRAAMRIRIARIRVFLRGFIFILLIM
jgi:hypothetical protein